MYVPEIHQNLLSVGQLIEKGFKVIFENKHSLIKDVNDKKIFNIKMRGQSFSFDHYATNALNNANSTMKKASSVYSKEMDQ